MRKKPLALYIHWPFCLSKCPYCDFNSHVREGIDEEKWKASLLKDLKSFYPVTQAFEISSIFFGGGTPSLMPPSIVETLLLEISNFYTLSPSLEVTLEANPTSVERKNFEALSVAGVNRLSLGIQSLQDKHLKFLGRTHSATDAMQAIDISDKFFKRRSFDLIYTLPNQSLESWKGELKEALSRANGHLSLYQLTIEQGTPFYLAAHRGDFSLPEEAASDAFFQWTHDFMKAQGYPAYEVSNFAQKGQECRHNKHYWQYDDYIGIGPGAHSRLTIDGEKYALRRHRSPEKWLEDVEKGDATHEKKRIQGKDLVEEYLMMALRLVDGFSLKDFKEKTGKDFLKSVPQERIEALQSEGLLTIKENVSLTFEGLKRLNALLAFLLKP